MDIVFEAWGTAFKIESIQIFFGVYDYSKSNETESLRRHHRFHASSQLTLRLFDRTLSLLVHLDVLHVLKLHRGL